MVTWMIFFNILPMVILALRVHAARLPQRSFRLDDGLIVVAYVGSPRVDDLE